MKKLLVYGNCHVHSLTNVLKSSPLFNDSYQIKSVAVHEDSSEKLKKVFTEYAPLSDVIIYQNISSDYRGLNVGSNRFESIEGPIKIKLTNAYYQGYFPDSGYLYSNGEHIEYSNVAVQDLNFFYRWMWKEGGVKHNTIWKYGQDQMPIYDSNFYKKEWSLQEHYLSLAKLEWREDLFNADVRVADYIRRNYQKKKLFHTLNHPAIDLFYEEGRQIMNILNLDPNTLSSVDDPMDFLTLPIYPSTKKNLGLLFDDKLEYKCNKIVYTPTEMNSLLHNFYLNMSGKDRDDNLERLATNKLNYW
jgi:hypothetical protein